MRSISILAIATIATLGSLAYIALRPNTLDDAISGLFGSMVGTLIGVALALHYDRLNATQQRELELNFAEQDRTARVHRAKLAVRDELTHNGTALLHLLDALKMTPNARADLWALARTIVESFETTSFRDLESLPRTVAEQRTDESIGRFYRNLVRLKHHVRRAETKHSVLLGYSANQTASDEELNAIRQSAATVRGQVDDALTKLPTEPAGTFAP